MTVLETPRLRLTPVTLDDVDVLHRIWCDPKVRQFLWDDVEIDRATAMQVVEQSVSDWSKHCYGFWLIHDREGQALGFVGFRSAAETEEPELLFGLLPAYWNQGIATEAGEAALAYLFESGRFTSAWAAADPPNAASFRVMQRLGMTFDRMGELNGLPAIFYRVTRIS